ncbi:lipoyl(octanoyl) transferase LipB [candidate division NPL-UPA2 bacterium]|nr:lipoyl(octanoyl) transferase LipB [candidate division NPL-UPA2 bacterium]
MNANRKCDVFLLGLLDYQKAWDLQRKLIEKRLKKRISDTLLLVEHSPLFTIGRGGSRKNVLVSDKYLKKKNISIYEVDRGGDITYHGPGQIVGYPILDLNEHGRDVHLVLRNLEEVIIRLLSGCGVEALRIPGYTGVWVEKEKIAAIGIGVRRWITFHGFCLNVNPDLNYFSLVNPCGLKGERVTSLQQLKVESEKGKVKTLSWKTIPGLKDLQQNLIRHFGEVFNLKMRYGEGTVPLGK